MNRSQNYPVNPKEEITVQTITSIECMVMSIILGKQATIVTTFKDINGINIKNCIDTIEGQDYLNWGSDDMYIPNWVCQKYGLTLSS